MQGLVRQSLALSTEKDCKFVAEASGALRRWVKAVQLAIDCLGKPMAEQSCLLEDTRKAGMQITKEILALYPPKDKKDTADRLNDLTARAFGVPQRQVEDAFRVLHGQLPTLVHKHVPPVQASVFLATTFQIMCMYRQEIDNMVLSQTVMPAQVIPNIWGVWQGIIEGLTLLGPLNCPASWLASLVEQVDGEPVKRATPVPPVTPAKTDKGKSFCGSSTKKSQPKQIPDFWINSKREREDEENWKREMEKHHKKSSGGPILSLAEHKELVSSLTSKTAPNRVSQPTNCLSWVIVVTPKMEKNQGKVSRPSPCAPGSSDDDPLSDKEPEPKPKGCKQDNTSPTPDDVVVLEDDDEPLLDSKPKTPAKKAKTLSPKKWEIFDQLISRLKSEGQNCQYSKEMADLVQYRNENIPNLCSRNPNTDDHSTHLATIKKRAWSYAAQGNLQMVKQFLKDLQGCGEPKKIRLGEHMLQARGLPRIPQDNTPPGAKQERIKAHYVMKVLRSVEGEIIDSTHPDFSQDQNIELHDIVSQESMNHIEKNGHIMYGGKVMQGKLDRGYCPLCPYNSQSHQMLNNHVRLHFCLTMVCGMPDCWQVAHNADDMWKHTVEHNLVTAEPIAQTKRSKKK